MSDTYEYFDEDGNPLSAEEVAALGDDVEIVEEVVESDEPMDLIEALDAFDLPDLDDFEIPEVPLDGGEQSAPAPVVVDDRELDEPVEIIEIDEPAPASSSLATESEPVVEAPVEPPAESPALALNRRAKMLLAGGAAAAVLLVVGGVAFALNGIGGQNTIDDVKAAGESKYAAASSAVVSKSSEVRDEAASVAIDTCRVGKLSGPGGLGDAMADGTEQPKLRLDVIAAAPLPGGFIAARTNADGKEGTPSLLQLTKTSWGAYTTTPRTRAEKKAEVDKPGFWKVDVQVGADSIRVTGDRIWAGGDTGGAGSCEPGEPGVYAATGKIPADAAGLVDGQAAVDTIQGVAGEADKAVAIMGNSIVLAKLVEGGEASSSVVPSK